MKNPKRTRFKKEKKKQEEETSIKYTEIIKPQKEKERNKGKTQNQLENKV